MTQFESDLLNMGPQGAIDYMRATCTPVNSTGTITTAVNAAMPKAQGGIYCYNDIGYYAPSYQQIVDLAACRSGIPALAWQDTVMDCDKFTKAYLGWLAKVGLGNLTIGMIGYVMFAPNGTSRGKHVVAIAMDKTNKAWLIEPQTGVVWEPSQYFAPGETIATSKQWYELIF